MMTMMTRSLDRQGTVRRGMVMTILHSNYQRLCSTLKKCGAVTHTAQVTSAIARPARQGNAVEFIDKNLHVVSEFKWRSFHQI